MSGFLLGVVTTLVVVIAVEGAAFMLLCAFAQATAYDD